MQRLDSLRPARSVLNEASGGCPQSCMSASAEQFQQRAEFLPLSNRGLGPLAVTELPIPLARRGTATACAAVT